MLILIQVFMNSISTELCWEAGFKHLHHKIRKNQGYGGCGESRTSGSVGEVHHSNVDIDSNKMGQQILLKLLVRSGESKYTAIPFCLTLSSPENLQSYP